MNHEMKLREIYFEKIKNGDENIIDETMEVIKNLK